MYYSPGIILEKSLFKMDEAKALTKNNQMEKTNHKQVRNFRCGSIKNLRITSNDCPVGIFYRRAKN